MTNVSVPLRGNGWESSKRMNPMSDNGNRRFRPLAGKWLGKLLEKDQKYENTSFCFRPLAGKWLGKPRATLSMNRDDIVFPSPGGEMVGKEVT